MKRREALGLMASGGLVLLTSQTASSNSLLSDSTKIRVIPKQAPVGLTTNLHPGVNTVYDARGQVYRFVANGRGTAYPLVLRGVPAGVGLTGARIVGEQSRSLTWSQMKRDRDGDGVHHKFNLGSMTVENIWIDNVEDGISFPTNSYASASWKLLHSYMRYIRDDAIENDMCSPGLVEDCLIDGCFIFYSERPGSGANGTCPSPQKTTTMRKVLVRLEPMPWDGDMGRRMGPAESYKSDHKGHGQLFKMGRNTGRVDCTDCVFVQTRMSVNHTSSMIWPPGTYTRCKLVWLGGGSWPGRPLPSGVTLTSSYQVWLDAKANWLNRHGGDAAGNNFPWLRR